MNEIQTWEKKEEEQIAGITYLPITSYYESRNGSGNSQYVNCKNQSMGWQRVGKGRSILKCKRSCSHFVGITKTKPKKLMCNFVKGKCRGSKNAVADTQE